VPLACINLFHGLASPHSNPSLTQHRNMKHQRATLPTPTSTNSFWHSEPNQFLLGHRTTEDLPAEADVVIVGSGITGTSAARYLSEDERAKGKTVVLLEAREACWGATGRVSCFL
jgi:hypothetical protein